MALRADQWLMIGVGGLGAYAVYRLITAKPREVSPEEIPILHPDGTPARPVPTSGPIDPGISAAQALRPGQWLRGRFDLAAGPDADGTPMGESAIDASSSKSQIRHHLEDLGFVDVTVYMTPAEAENTILVPDRLANATAGTRWFAARWPTQAEGGRLRTAARSRRFTGLWFAQGAPQGFVTFAAPGYMPLRQRAFFP